MSASHHLPAGPLESSHHVVPVRTYLLIFSCLIVLTAITVWVAFIDLGILNVAVMLGIALTKATLVTLYFMHVRWTGGLVAVVATSGFLFLAILLAFIFADVLQRGVPV